MIKTKIEVPVLRILLTNAGIREIWVYRNISWNFVDITNEPIF